MALTEQQRHNFNILVARWKKQNEAFVKRHDNRCKFLLGSDMDGTSELKSRISFMDTYQEEAQSFIRDVFTDAENMYLGMRDPDAVQILKEQGVYELAKDVRSMENVRPGAEVHIADPGRDYPGASQAEINFRTNDQVTRDSANFMINNSLTATQQQNLRKVRKFLYESAEETGYESLGSDGNVRAYIDEFTKKPLGVQMAAIYMVNTRKRKSPDPVSVTLAESQCPENDMDPKLFAKQMTQHWAKRYINGNRLAGTHKFWAKLKTSVNIAEKSESIDQVNAMRAAAKTTYGGNAAPVNEDQAAALKTSAYKDILELDELQKSADALEGLQERAARMSGYLQALRAFDNIPPEERGDAEAFRQSRTRAMNEVLRAADDVKKFYEDHMKEWHFPKKMKCFIENTKGLYDTTFSANGPLIYGTATALIENGTAIKHYLENDETKFRVTQWIGEKLQENDFIREKLDFINKLGGKTLADNYVGLTDGLQSGIIGLGTIAGALNDGIKFFGTKGTKTEKFDTALSFFQGLTAGASNSASTAKNILMKVKGLTEDDKAVKQATTAMKHAGLCAKVIGVVRNGWNAFRSGLRWHRARKLEGSMAGDPQVALNEDATQEEREAKAKKDAEKKTMETATAMTRRRSKWRFLKYVGLGILAGLGVVAAVVTGPAAAACVGGATAINTVGSIAINKFSDHGEKRAESNKAVDDELLKTDECKDYLQANQGQKVINWAVNQFKTRLEEKKDRFERDSSEVQTIEDRKTNEDLLKRYVRDAAAVKAGALNKVDFAAVEHKKAIDQAFQKVFFQDGSNTMTMGNLREETDWLFKKNERNSVREARPTTQEIKQKKELLHFYDFLEMNGVKMAPSQQKAKHGKSEAENKFNSIMERKTRAEGKRK